jgi:hypothetical protein
MQEFSPLLSLHLSIFSVLSAGNIVKLKNERSSSYHTITPRQKISAYFFIFKPFRGVPYLPTMLSSTLDLPEDCDPTTTI